MKQHPSYTVNWLETCEREYDVTNYNAQAEGSFERPTELRKTMSTFGSRKFQSSLGTEELGFLGDGNVSRERL